MPGDDHFDGLAHEDFIKIFDSNGSFEEKFDAEKRSGLPPVDGVYTLLDVDNQYLVAGKGFVRIYSDTTPGDRLSSIAVRKQWNQPKDITGSFMGMNMTFDGRLLLATTDGFVLALSRDFSDVKSVRLPHATDEIPSLPKGVIWVRNGFAVDEKGGVYVASNQHLHKVIWTGAGPFGRPQRRGLERAVPQFARQGHRGHTDARRLWRRSGQARRVHGWRCVDERRRLLARSNTFGLEAA
jgi:hypothetical protein